MRLDICREMLRFQEDEASDHHREIIDRTAESDRESQDIRIRAGQNGLTAGNDRAWRYDAAIMLDRQECGVGKSEQGHDEDEDNGSASDLT